MIDTDTSLAVADSADAAPHPVRRWPAVAAGTVDFVAPVCVGAAAAAVGVVVEWAPWSMVVAALLAAAMLWLVAFGVVKRVKGGATLGRSAFDTVPQSDEQARAARLGTVALLALLVGNLVVLTAVSALWQRPNDIAVAEAQQFAAGAATEGVLAMYSYDPTTVDAYLDDATAHLTGEMLSSFTTYAEQYVVPVVVSQNLSMESAVSGSAVESVSDGRATVLLFMTRSLSTNGADPQQFQSAVRVEMTRVDGIWLIAKFDPIQ